MAAKTVRVALCQLLCGADKLKNLETALAAIKEAAANKAQIVALPECFNAPYATDQFPVYAEPIPANKASIVPETHISCAALSKAAEEHKIWLIGGSIPEEAFEEADGAKKRRIYNTCVVYGPDGEILAKHRKMHLFDINIPGKITFQESDTLSPGDASLATFETPFGKVGLGICYDMRFPYLAMLLRQAGCKMIFYPGAFNTTTGPAHWELLLRGRALDTQSFVAGISPARNPESAYQAWGHSTMVNPWGEVISTVDEKPAVIYADLDLERLEVIREQIPVSKQARTDVYSLSLLDGLKGRDESSTKAMVERQISKA